MGDAFRPFLHVIQGWYMDEVRSAMQWKTSDLIHLALLCAHGSVWWVKSDLNRAGHILIYYTYLDYVCSLRLRGQ